jgi:hypothetical protein
MDVGDPTQQQTAGKSAERVAFNDDLFRKANERIREKAAALGVADRGLPFICECAEPSCTEVLLINTDAYREIRSHPRWFLNAPGHEVAAQGWAEVVERHDGYVVAEKIGRAGEVVEALDDPYASDEPA